MSVLRQLTSHLLLIRTNLGCGSVLTAACASRGYSAIDYYYYYHHHYHPTLVKFTTPNSLNDSTKNNPTETNN
jgi:hypothetical protein